MNQTWKDIKDYEGYYQVSENGNVRSCDRTTIGRYGTQNRKGKEMKLHLDKDGYVKVGLTKNKKTNHFFVHRLVSISFIKNQNNLNQVNHKDGNKQNNLISNLEWCDSYHNNVHALITGLRKMPNGENHFNSKLTKDEAIWIKYQTNNQSFSEISKIFGISKSLICLIKSGKRWSEI